MRATASGSPPRSNQYRIGLNECLPHNSHTAHAAATPTIAAIKTVVRSLAGGARPGSGTT
ncbi:MAG TPA: hypothetical protein VFI54_15690 [Solirubrobacteraceae bacterium]|nr:hypothetical protein [Solirubrobacteraceae bacterium]